MFFRLFSSKKMYVLQATLIGVLSTLFLTGCITVTPPATGVPPTQPVEDPTGIPPTQDMQMDPPVTPPTRVTPPTSSESQSTTYVITVNTSCIDYAGTDADVEISIIGTDDSINNYFLDSNNDDFEKCHSDRFSTGEVKDIGDITKVRISHDDSGGNSGWHLANIIIHNERTNSSWMFNCNCWLATDEPPYTLTQTLYPNQ